MNDHPASQALRHGLTIVADDLTGVLDTAGAFASGGPVTVDLDGSWSSSSRLGIDTDSRESGREEAMARSAAVFARRTRSGLWFKKVDSVLRGWPIEETCAAFKAGGFRRILFAPAFPDTGRMTMGGRQHVWMSSSWTPVGPPLAEAFQSQGLRAGRLGDVGLEGSDVVVADVTFNADFQKALQSCGADCGDTLFVGSGGLAAALAGPSPVLTPNPIPEIAICGTLHPATRTQVAVAAAEGIDIVTLDGDEPRAWTGPVVFDAPLQVSDPGEAARRIAASLRLLVERAPAPRSVIVTGGATLRLLLEAAHASAVSAYGLRRPGIALGTVLGGSWNGTFIVSKSGGFGPPDFLVSELRFPAYP